MSAKQQNETSTVVVSIIVLVAVVVAIILVVNFLPSVCERVTSRAHESPVNTPSAKDLVKKEADRLEAACSKGSKKECDYLDAVGRR